MAHSTKTVGYKLTQAVRQKIVEGLERGNPVETAANRARVSVSSLKVWRSAGREAMAKREAGEELTEDEEILADFELDVQAAQAGVLDEAAHTVKEAFATSWQAAMTYLERRDRKHWSRPPAVQVVEDTAPRAKFDLTLTDDPDAAPDGEAASPRDPL